MTDETTPELETATDAVADDTEALEGVKRTLRVEDAPLDPIEKLARKMGHRPKEDWVGDDTDWIDAATFVERQTDKTKERLDRLQGEVQQISKTATTLAARHREDALRQAREEVRRAAFEGDAQAIEDAAQNLERVTTAVPPGQPPEVQAFVQKHPWLLEDESAGIIAARAGEKSAKAGGSVTDQLVAAERELKRVFPDKFEAPRQTKAPPAVQAGTRATPTTPREKGVADLPAEAKQAGQKFIRAGMVKDMADYAKAYFEENKA